MKKYTGILVTTILLLPLLFQITPLEILKLKTFDAFIPRQEPTGNFIILDITEEDIAQEGGWPLPRERLAEIHIELLKAGSLGVGWVLSFPQPDRMGGDEAFANALNYGPTVMSMFENDNGSYPPTTGTVILGEDTGGGFIARGVVENIDILKQYSAQGIASAPIDVDGLVRQIPLLLRTDDGFASSFSLEVLQQLVQQDTFIINMNDSEITVPSLPPIKVDSMLRKWISYVDTPTIGLNELDKAADAYVIVGTSGGGIMPQVSTPVGLLYPHELQASITESLLIPNTPQIPELHLAIEVSLFILLVLISWLLTQKLSMTIGLLSFTSVFVSTLVFGIYTIKNGYLVDVTWTLISQFILASISYYLKFVEQYKLRQQIKKQFEHYLDPRQVKQLQKHPEQLKLGGEKRYATFLFTDVRGFTSLSETLEPEEVTYIMNKALTAQQKAVQAHGGMVDKYIGDAMMAIFNAPLDLDHHENKAIDCAKDIQRNMDILNDELLEKGIKPVAIGIGINTGYAVIGNMGSEQRFDYTAIGDAVNTGARLESGTKDAGVDLLIGYNTAIKSDYTLKKLEPIEAKGKKEPLQVYTWA
tara:strand:+ start:2998 stop:4761 length:1764 start_codon:yes stop_codon:yes gene_type:complete